MPLSNNGKSPLEFAVHDTGIGIPPAGQERLHRPYTTGGRIPRSNNPATKIASATAGTMYDSVVGAPRALHTSTAANIAIA